MLGSMSTSGMCCGVLRSIVLGSTVMVGIKIDDAEVDNREGGVW